MKLQKSKEVYRVCKKCGKFLDPNLAFFDSGFCFYCRNRRDIERFRESQYQKKVNDLLEKKQNAVTKFERYRIDYQLKDLVNRRRYFVKYGY